MTPCRNFFNTIYNIIVSTDISTELLVKDGFTLLCRYPLSTTPYLCAEPHNALKECWGSGYGIRCFLTPGSGIRDRKNPDPGSGIQDEHTGSYFWELIISFLGQKYLNSLMRDRIRDLVNPGSWMGKIGLGIRDKHPGSAALLLNLVWTLHASHMVHIWVDTETAMQK